MDNPISLMINNENEKILIATITNVTLTLTDDHTKQTVRAWVFEVLLGEGVLDEDWGQDEVYGLLKLVNLSTLVEVKKKTNTVAHSC